MSFLAQLLVLVSVAHICNSDESLKSTNGSESENNQTVESMNKFSHSWHQFQSFRQKFDKKYGSTSEEQKRFQIFGQNLKKIEKLNAVEKGTAVYGVTKMADWSPEEFLAKRASLKPTEIAKNSEFMKKVNLTLLDDDDPIPDAFDWRSTLSVTSVKDQRDCGSCWAFATVGNIENIHAIQKGFLQDYSVQQLVDCSNKALGCEGGSLTSGFETVMDMGGLVSESKYPYTAMSSVCNFSLGDVAVKIGGFVVLYSLDEEGMVRYVAMKGSTVNAVKADLLQFYESGIIVADEREPLNHLVLVVGYGRDVDSGLDFWTVKNSWGQNWGEAGYFRLGRGNNTCGIASFISSVELEAED